MSWWRLPLAEHFTLECLTTVTRRTHGVPSRSRQLASLTLPLSVTRSSLRGPLRADRYRAGSQVRARRSLTPLYTQEALEKELWWPSL